MDKWFAPNVPSTSCLFRTRTYSSPSVFVTFVTIHWPIRASTAQKRRPAPMTPTTSQDLVWCGAEPIVCPVWLAATVPVTAVNSNGPLNSRPLQQHRINLSSSSFFSSSSSSSPHPTPPLPSSSLHCFNDGVSDLLARVSDVISKTWKVLPII